MLNYLLIALLLASIIWILYSKTKGFTNSTRVSVKGYARLFSFEPDLWNRHWLKVVGILSAALAICVLIKLN